MLCCIWLRRTDPSGRSLYGSAYVQNAEDLRAEKTDCPYTFFPLPLRGETLQVEVPWGYEKRVTWGERESFSWTHFMDVLGRSDENGGG